MEDYVMMLVGASLLTGVLFVICPKKHQRYLRLIGGFCMIAILIRPLPSCLAAVSDRLSSVGDGIGEEDALVYEEIYHQTLRDANQTRIESFLEERFYQAYSLENSDLSVSVMLQEEDGVVSVKKTIVFLSGRAILVDPDPIIAYVEEVVSCPCEIVYGTAEK